MITNMETSNLYILNELLSDDEAMSCFCDKKKTDINSELNDVCSGLIETLRDNDVDEEKGRIETIAFLSQQVILKDFLGDLEQHLSAQVLFAQHTPDLEEQHAVAYVIDNNLGMFVINIDSYQHGIVDEMYLSFYDSIDTMFIDVKETLAENIINEDKNTVFEEKMEFTQLWKDFFENIS